MYTSSLPRFAFNVDMLLCGPCSSVGILTVLRFVLSRIRGWVRDFFSPPKRPDRQWGWSRLLFNGYRIPPPPPTSMGQAAGVVKLTTYIHVVLRSKLHFPICLHGVLRDSFTFCKATKSPASDAGNDSEPGLTWQIGSVRSRERVISVFLQSER